MASPTKFRTLAGILAGLIIHLACSHPGTDSHTEVFHTPEQVQADRLSKQLATHKDLAVSLLRFSRPDIDARPTDGTSITIAADGVKRDLDLAPIEDELLHHSDHERAILRHFLDGQLRPFDVDRLKSIGYERSKSMLGVELASGKDLDDLTKLLGDAKPLSAPVVTNLHRVIVIRRTKPAVTVPITSEIIEAWQASTADVESAALQNLRASIDQPAAIWFDTVSFGPAGRSGNLKSGVDASIILLPEFLTAVQKAWNVNDDLVICVPSATSVTFAERKNERLLASIIPQWKKLLAGSTNPLCDQLLLRDAQKLSQFSGIGPATQPATAPTTKPHTYIVH